MKRTTLFQSIINYRNFFVALTISTALTGFWSCSKSAGTTNNNNPQNPQAQSSFIVQTIGSRAANTLYDQIAVQADGKIIAMRSGISFDTLVRLLPSGEIDPQFSSMKFSGNDDIFEILVQPDQKILLLGKMSLPGNPGLIRLNANGQFDKNLVTLTSNATMSCMALQPDGKIIIGGNFSSPQNTYKLIRVNSEGVLDNSFVSPLSSKDGTVSSIVMDSQGRIVIGGRLPIDGDAASPRDVVRLKTDGSVDQTFNFKDHIAVPETGSAFPAVLFKVAVDKQDRIFIGGDFNEVRSSDGSRTKYNNIVRVKADGTLDKEFTYADKGPGRVTAILPLANGDVIVGRYWTYILMSQPSESVNIYSAKGEYRDFTLGFVNGYVNDIIQEAPQQFLVSGGFSKASPPQVGLCRLTQK